MNNKNLTAGFFTTVAILAIALCVGIGSASARRISGTQSTGADAFLLLPPPIPSEEVYTGVYLQDAAANHCAAILAFNAQARKTHIIYSRYVSINNGEDWWNGSPTNIGDFVECVKTVGGIPMLILELDHPFTATGLSEGDQNWLRDPLAKEIRDFGTPMFLNLIPEMNLLENKGQGPLTLDTYQAAYRAAFCDAKQILNNAGAINAATVWSPNQKWANTDPAWDYDFFYPGDNCVDWVSLDYYLHKNDNCDDWVIKAALNGDEYNNYFYERFSAPTPRAIFTPARTVTPHGKPMMLAETAASDWARCTQNWYLDRLYNIHGSDRPAPFIDKEFPNLHGIVWFNQDKMPDTAHPLEEPWSIKDYEHYASVIAPSYFIGTSLPTVTATSTSTPTFTPTSTPSSTPTATPTPTATLTPTSTSTQTPSITPTSTSTLTPTPTWIYLPLIRYRFPLPTPTPSPTPTATPSPFFEGSWEVEPNNTVDRANGPLRPNRDYFGRPEDEFDVFYFETTGSGQIVADLTNHFGTDVQFHLIYANTGELVGYDDSPPYYIEYYGQAGRYVILVYTAPESQNSNPYTLRASFP